MVSEQLDENDFRHYYGIFFESTILKLLDDSYVQTSFATIAGQFDNERHLKRYIKVEDFTDMNHHIN